ncbi:MAG: NAD(P)(+) transhydrogenase (Re/Si-specific) subunit beta [Polyangiaceae bacterium]|nr:NAD(P)(+) transhydrogenase (Re/Si-specific) subunit beta [Polyangiaceae bacterium]
MAREYFVQVAYLLASGLFILGLKGMGSAETARRGMFLAEAGMLLAVIGTLLQAQILRYEWILVGLAVGSAVGVAISLRVPMTAMPQRIAASHAFGALAATLVGVAEFLGSQGHGEVIEHPKMAALGFEVMFGSLTVTGSIMAFGKLQEILPSAPITYRGQNATNIALFLATVGLYVYLIVVPDAAWAFYAMIGLGLAIGILIVLPIGGADMPVVISLLNSYAGLASSATGFAIGNNVLIIAGALDGASGFILSILMSRAMNRSFTNVLFGAFGSAPAAAALKGGTALPVREVTIEDAAVQLAFARRVIVVPGYGLAVAQAQHQVRELAQQVERQGGEVLYAIHPVAGRMPGHMNVLLAEANVPYDALRDMDEINPDFPECDVSLVVGANDVVNPAARTDQSSPIFGMPILDVDKSKSIIVMKRSMNPGFAGIENALFYDPKTAMLFGDAKSSLSKLVAHMKGL